MLSMLSVRGLSPERPLRLKGKGVPYINGRGRGDQYVKVIVEVPKNLNKKQRDKLKEFESVMNDGKHYEKRESFASKLKDFTGKL